MLCPFCPQEAPDRFFGTGRANLNSHPLSVHGTDRDGKPKPVLQKLDLAEVITGCFIVAIGGLFLSFNM